MGNDTHSNTTAMTGHTVNHVVSHALKGPMGPALCLVHTFKPIYSALVPFSFLSAQAYSLWAYFSL